VWRAWQVDLAHAAWRLLPQLRGVGHPHDLWIVDVRGLDLPEADPPVQEDGHALGGRGVRRGGHFFIMRKSQIGVKERVVPFLKPGNQNGKILNRNLKPPKQNGKIRPLSFIFRRFGLKF